MRDGKETPDDVVSKIRVVIKDDKHSVYFGDDVVGKEIPFNIDATKKPKETTDTLPDGKTIRGIYMLDGDTLTSCVVEPDKEARRIVDRTADSQSLVRFDDNSYSVPGQYAHRKPLVVATVEEVRLVYLLIACE